MLALTLLGCGLETRGPVLVERDAASQDTDAPDDAGCSVPSCNAAVVLEDDSLTPHIGGDAGSAYIDRCADSQLLIGYAGSLREISATAAPIEVVTSLEAVCGVPSFSDTGALRIGASQRLPVRGDTRGSYAAWTRLCPSDHVVVGVDARAGLALDRLALKCAAAVLDPATDALSFASELTLQAAGGGGGNEVHMACPSGQVARGHTLRAGRWIDAFGLICATPQPAIAGP